MEGVVAICLCLGKAERMRPLSLGTPKHLIKFCLRPLIEYSLEQMQRHRIKRIVLVTGLGDSSSEQYRSWGADRGLEICVVQRGLEFGSAGVVRDIVEKELNGWPAGLIEDALVIFGDSLFDIDLNSMLEAHRSHGKTGGLATVAYHRPNDLIRADATHSNYGILSLGEDERVFGFSEKPPVDAIESPFASAGVFVFNRSGVALFPSECPIDLSADVLASFASGGGSPVFGFNIEPGYRYDIGTTGEYLDRQLEVVSGVIRLHGCPRNSTACDASPSVKVAIQGDALIGGHCAIGSDVSLRGRNVVADGVSIGAEVQIEDSIILDYAQIGRGAKVSRSIIGPFAEVGEKTELVDSVLGGWSIIR